MQCRRCLQICFCVLFVVVGYFWFFRGTGKEPRTIHLKLRANEKALLMSDSRDLPHEFLSPNHGHKRREPSHGVIEVESQETNIRRVRPPIFMQGEQDSGDIAAAAKRPKKTRANRQVRRNRRARSVSMKDAMKGNHPFQIGDSTRNQPSDGFKRIRNAAFQLYSLQKNTETVDADQDMDSNNYEIINNRPLIEENETSKYAYFHRTFNSHMSQEGKQAYNEKVSGSTNQMAEDMTNKTAPVLKENDFGDRHQGRHGESEHASDSTDETVEHQTNETTLTLEETVEDRSVEHQTNEATLTLEETVEDRSVEHLTNVTTFAPEETVEETNTPCNNTKNCIDNKSEDENETDDANTRGHVVKKRQAVDADKPISQEFPEALRLAVVDELVLSDHFSQSRPLGDVVELSCQNEAMAEFRREIPMVRTQWLLNGEHLDVKASRMLFRGNDLLIIQDLTTQDSGVYECRVEYGRNKALTVAVFTLTVTTSVPTLFFRETEPMVLDSHSYHLAQVLRVVDLTRATDPLFGCKPPCLATNLSHHTTRQWFFNGNRSTLFPEHLSAHHPTLDRVSASTPDMAGVWWCQVHHSPSGKRWTTSWSRVYIKDPPPLIEKLWRGLLRRPWLMSTLGALLLVTCTGVAVLLARYAQKQHENLEVRWQETKARLMSQAPEFSLSGSATNECSSMHKWEPRRGDVTSSTSPTSSLPTSPQTVRTSGKSQSSRSTLEREK